MHIILRLWFHFVFELFVESEFFWLWFTITLILKKIKDPVLLHIITIFKNLKNQITSHKTTSSPLVLSWTKSTKQNHGSLVLWNPPNRMLQIVFLLSLKSPRRGGLHGLGSMMFGLVLQKFLNIEWFLHRKLN